jgi:hypothetical protein
VWKPSIKAIRVTSPGELEQVVSLLSFMSQSDDCQIQAMTERTKQEFFRDGINRWALLANASEQLAIHRSVWRVHADKEPKRRTYEMPLVSQSSPLIKYFKFQFQNDPPVLHDPTKVQLLIIDYHVNDQGIEVQYAA